MAPKQTKVYSPLMRFEKYLFAIEDIRLPVPVTLRQVGIFFTTLGVVWVLGRLPILGGIINGPLLVLSYLAVPIASMIFFTKANIDGKPPFAFILSMLYHQFTKGIYHRYKRMDKPAKYKYSTPITYRKEEKE